MRTYHRIQSSSFIGAFLLQVYNFNFVSSGRSLVSLLLHYLAQIASKEIPNILHILVLILCRNKLDYVHEIVHTQTLGSIIVTCLRIFLLRVGLELCLDTLNYTIRIEDTTSITD